MLVPPPHAAKSIFPLYLPQDLVKKHSEFIGFPIELMIEKSEEKEVTDDEDDEDDEDGEGNDEPKIEEVKEGEEIYVSREELLAENPQNPKICGGMEVRWFDCSGISIFSNREFLWSDAQ